jgi:type IV fimbrial biogenesis protein FimT
VTSLSRSDAWRHRGFTLLELVVVMTIVGVLMAIAIPSYQYVITDNRVAAEVNDLLAAMQYARAEAIKEGNDVVVCSSTSGTACSGAPSWQSGWIVFSDPDNNGTLEAGETVLKYHNALTGGDTFVSADNSTSAVQFSRDGFAVGLANAGVNMQLHNSTGSSTYSRCLDVSIVGALTTVSYGGALAGSGTCQ